MDELSSRGGPTLALGRRAGPPRSGLVWRIADLASLAGRDIPPGTDAAFCCLGTTIKVAGSQEAFRRVDYDFVMAFARACREAGVEQLHVVSSAGANAASRFFYPRVKGELERDLQTLGFRSLTLYRPSLMTGQRTEHRMGEKATFLVGRALTPLLSRDLRPIAASTVARAMVRTALAPSPGTTLVPSGEIARAGS